MMDERKQQAALIINTVHKLCTEFGFVLEPYTLENGLNVVSIYDVKENKRLFILKNEEVN